MSVEAVRASLEGTLAGVLRAREPLARHTTFHIGGPAALLVEADTLADLKQVTRSCMENGVECVVLGKGSNVLASDTGFDGVVVVLGREFKRHSVMDERIKAGAGVILAHVVREAYSRGLSGLEFAVGVPGTVGGAAVMNAGSREEWIGSVVESVTLFDPVEGLRVLHGSEIEWGYRSSGIPAGSVVVECLLHLEAGDRDRIRRAMDDSLARRKASQPLGVPSAGSVFVNPAGESAGRLVEEAGLKGHRIGGAEISAVHANFIVNRGDARAVDVIMLMRAARDAVRGRYGIELTPEIRFLGSFERP